jgi:hypothetical protein
MIKFEVLVSSLHSLNGSAYLRHGYTHTFYFDGLNCADKTFKARQLIVGFI